MYENEYAQDQGRPFGETVISLKDIGLTYQTDSAQVDAIKDINLDIRKGEFLCVLGPSGCGKSTVLKLLAGFEQPTAGTATMGGEPIAKPDWNRGVVFQHPALYPWLNVWDNAAFGLKMRGIKTIDERTAHFIDRVGLNEFKRHRVYELSGGMKQRLSIARVLVNDPVILLMDEPFGALDALTRSQMQTMLRSIWAETHKTVFFITHDVDEALLLATKILVMSPRPGRFIKDINVDFAYRITDGQTDHIRFSKEYEKVREEVLDLICTEKKDYAI